jgi:aldehyde:ferredoxin oxidoreductase
MIICKFLRKCFTDFYSEGAELLSKVTGWDCTGNELRRIGQRIHTLKKLFNIREGWRTEDDWLPPRLLVDALPTGVGRGTSLTPAELNEMIHSYYQARGWDDKGFVSEENLRELGLIG